MIAISARGKSPEDPVDQRLGRCEYFVFYDPETGEFSGLENPFRLEGSGAGINTAQFLTEKKVGAILTGNVGPKALQVLHAAGIKVYTNSTGRVQDALQAYQQGQLSPASAPTVPESHGKRPGPRRGRKGGL